jgi:hypothetical protein
VNASIAASPPWYRHRWPWLLMAGPATVIVAGIVTLWLAVRSNDGLVADDYYKQGLAINRTLERSERAAAMGLKAWFAVRDGRAVLRLESRAGAALPSRVRLKLTHPTRSGFDQALLLTRADGIYTGPLEELASGHWQVIVEDEAGTWRLAGAATPAEKEAALEPLERQRPIKNRH